MRRVTSIWLVMTVKAPGVGKGSFWTGFKIVLTLAWPSHFVLISSAEQLRPVPGPAGALGVRFVLRVVAASQGGSPESSFWGHAER